MKWTLRLTVTLATLTVAAPLEASTINAALGKPVTISGDVGVITCCWPDSTVYPPAALSTIVDGAFLTEGTEWQDGTVWWDEFYAGSANNIIEVDLQGWFLIDWLVIQADNNDSYGISYRDVNGAWIPYGHFADVPGFGMMTREGILAPFVATALRIDAFGGDAWYSVSEFQAFGTPVPEPATLLLLGTGLGAVAARRRLKKRA